MVPNYSGSNFPENLEVSLRCYKDALIFYQYTYHKCDYLYVGIDELKGLSTSISIRPNPSRGTFVLKTMMERSSELTGILSDVSGRIVASLYIPFGVREQEFQFNLASGIYFLKLKSVDGFYSQKLVIQ